MADPSELTYGTITGRMVSVIRDRVLETDADADSFPDIVPVTGNVTFTPSIKSLAVRTAAEPFIAVLRPITATLDATGLLNLDGTPGVQLVATDNPNADPIDFTYSVSFEGLSDTTGPIEYQRFSIRVLGGEVVSIGKLAPVPTGGGTTIVADPYAVDALKKYVDDLFANGGGGGGGGTVDLTARGAAEAARQLAEGRYLLPASGIPLEAISQAAIDELQSTAETKVSVGEFNFGGCSAGTSFGQGTSAVRVPFEFTVTPRRYRISFENYVGLDDYSAENAIPVTLGGVYVGAESQTNLYPYQYDETPDLIGTGGALNLNTKVVTDWITPTEDLKGVPQLLSYQLSTGQASTWVGVSYGTHAQVTYDQSRVADLNTSGDWYSAPIPLAVKIEFEFDDTGVTKVLGLGDSIMDAWAAVQDAGWVGQLTGFMQNWARNTGGTVAVNAFGQAAVRHYAASSTKWGRINPDLDIDVVVLSLGANDIVGGYSLADTQAGILSIIGTIKQRYPGTRIYLVNCIPLGSDEDGLYEQREAFNAWLGTLSSRVIDGIVDTSGIEMVAWASRPMDPRFLSRDGLHPNPRAHSVFDVPFV